MVIKALPAIIGLPGVYAPPFFEGAVRRRDMAKHPYFKLLYYTIVPKTKRSFTLSSFTGTTRSPSPGPALT